MFNSSLKWKCFLTGITTRDSILVITMTALADTLQVNNTLFTADDKQLKTSY